VAGGGGEGGGTGKGSALDGHGAFFRSRVKCVLSPLPPPPADDEALKGEPPCVAPEINVIRLVK